MKKKILIFIIAFFIPIVTIPLQFSTYTLGSVTIITSIIYFLFEYFVLKRNDKEIKQQNILGLSLLGNIIQTFINCLVVSNGIDKVALSMILAPNLMYGFSIVMSYLLYSVTKKYKLVIILFSILGYLLLTVTSQTFLSQLIN